jgi:hypothetical protein
VQVVLPLAELHQEVSVPVANAQVNTDADSNLDVVALNYEALKNLLRWIRTILAPCPGFWTAARSAQGGVTLVVDGWRLTKWASPASAIQESRSIINPYSAEYSRPGRGRIEVITKPGTAHFHGEFNFLFRDQHFNARDVFATTRPAEQRRIFEGNFFGAGEQEQSSSDYFSDLRQSRGRRPASHRLCQGAEWDKSK